MLLAHPPSLVAGNMVSNNHNSGKGLHSCRKVPASPDPLGREHLPIRALTVSQHSIKSTAVLQY